MSLPYHFYNTICGLRQREELILYDRIITFIPEDEKLVTDFLQIEYETECSNYPYTAPLFNAAAALWAAKITYSFSQLVLYREHAASDLSNLLPPYEGIIDAGAILSADLCLRFLPGLAYTIRNIDPEDALLLLLQQHLQQWHYSAVGYRVDISQMDMEPVVANNCLLQLYADRVIQKEDSNKALHPALLETIKASLGLYAPLFWKVLNTTIENEQH